MSVYQKDRLLASKVVVSYFVTCFGLLLLSTLPMYAQAKVGGNPQSMHPSAAFEVESANRGFLPPRVALTSITDAATIPAPAEGLLVYNNGVGALKEKGYYYWNGSQWTAISGFSSSSDGDMRVGETRTSLVAVDRNLFLPGSAGVFRTWMNNRNAGNNQLVNYQLLSSVANINDFIVFDGLRMDVASGGYLAPWYYSMKLVNTTNQTRIISVFSHSGSVQQWNLGRMVLDPNAVCWVLDDNDGFTLSENEANDCVQSQVLVHDPITGNVRYYVATWWAVWVNDDNGRSRIVATFTVTRQR
jgi:hypothetical protein